MGKITRFKAPVTCADSCISMQKNHVQERFSYLRLHHRYLPPDRVMVWSLNSCLDPHFSASYVRSNRKHIDPFPPNNQSTCSDIGASAFEGNSWFGTWCQYVPNVVSIRSERGCDTFRTWLRYVPNVVSIRSERGLDTFRTWLRYVPDVVRIRSGRGLDTFGTWCR